MLKSNNKLTQKFFECNNILKKTENEWDTLIKALEDQGFKVDPVFVGKSRYMFINDRSKTTVMTKEGHPVGTVRIAGHWSWHRKDTEIIQCNYAQGKWAHDCPNKKGEYTPRRASAIAIVLPDGKYHCISGEIYFPKTKEWDYKPLDIKEAISLIKRYSLL